MELGVAEVAQTLRRHGHCVGVRGALALRHRREDGAAALVLHVEDAQQGVLARPIQGGEVSNEVDPSGIWGSAKK
eukprot:13628853-Alexandrium_andersonii.AAC.1